MLLLLAIVCAVATAFLQELSGADALRLTVRPNRFGFQGSDIEVRTRVEPGDRNRQLVIQVDGDSYAAQSTRQIDGSDAPATQRSLWLHNPPPGRYHVTAILLECVPGGCGRLQVRARAQHELEILEGVPKAR
jgi:hypothetical protein